jgi:hypothetical protein
MRQAYLVSIALLFATPAFAHEREFVQSRDWFLPYKGEHEFELRSFFDTSHGEFLGKFEYEFGVTSWFAIEPGLELKEKENGNYEVEGAELELRFHFWELEYGRWLPAVNLEYEQPFEDEPGEEPAIEVKTVLSRYGEDGKDFTINLNFGKQLSGEKESESELTAGFIMPLDKEAGPSAGWHDGLRAGVELVEDFEEGDLRIGPLLVYRLSGHWNFLTSYVFAINDRDGSNFDELAFILEFEL